MRYQPGIPAAGAAVLVVTLLVGCGGDDPPPSDTTPSAPIAGPEPSPTPEPTAPPEPPDPAPGFHEVVLEWEDQHRVFHVDAPEGFDPREPTPLVVVLHGGGSTAAAIRHQARGEELSAEENVLVAYPEGVNGEWQVLPDRDPDDDLGFMTAMVEFLVDEWGAAPDQVYAAGWSNGAEMSYRLASEASGVFAAVAPVSGNMIREPESPPANPVSVFGVVGLADRAVVDGDSLEAWRDLLDCEAAAPVDVDDTVTRIDATCPDGSEVVEYRLDGVGHVWPNAGTHAFDATATIWEHFRTVTR